MNIYIHEIDNDGRGDNTWEVSADGKSAFSSEKSDVAFGVALILAKRHNATITIYPIEWYYAQEGNS